MIIRVYENNPQMRAINKAVEILQSGGLVVYPTDTIYGLGCDLHNKKALKKIFRIKEMDEKSPFKLYLSGFKRSIKICKGLKPGIPGHE